MKFDFLLPPLVLFLLSVSIVSAGEIDFSSDPIEVNSAFLNSASMEYLNYDSSNSRHHYKLDFNGEVLYLYHSGDYSSFDLYASEDGSTNWRNYIVPGYSSTKEVNFDGDYQEIFKGKLRYFFTQYYTRGNGRGSSSIDHVSYNSDNWLEGTSPHPFLNTNHDYIAIDNVVYAQLKSGSFHLDKWFSSGVEEKSYSSSQSDLADINSAYSAQFVAPTSSLPEDISSSNYGASYGSRDSAIDAGVTCSSGCVCEADLCREINEGTSEVNYFPSNGFIGSVSDINDVPADPSPSPVATSVHSQSSLSRGSTSQTSSTPVTSNIPPHMSCGSTTKCEELHKVWTKIGPMMSKNQYWKPSSKFNGQWISNFDQLGLRVQTPVSPVNPSPNPSPAPITSATGIDHLAMTGGTPYMRAFLRMITVKEGAKTSCGQVSAYQTLVGGTASASPRLGVRGENGCNKNYFVGFESHPNIRVSGGYGVSTAAGRYQFLSSTWNGWNSRYGSNGDFSPSNQDRVVYTFLERKGIGPILESMGPNPDINSQSFITSWQKIMAPTAGTMSSLSSSNPERYQRLNALDGGNFNGVSGGKGLGSIWASLPYGCYASQGCHGVNSDRSSQTASYYKALLEEELSPSPNPNPNNSVAMNLQGKKVLYIGDSHVAGMYGKEMDRLLKTVASTVETYGCVGSSAGNFISGGRTCRLGSTFKNSVMDYDLPSVNTLMQSFQGGQPEVIVISLGGNYISSPQSSSSLINAVQGKICYWIGPTHAPTHDVSGVNSFYSTLETIKQHCNVLDARPHTESLVFCGTDPHFRGSCSSTPGFNANRDAAKSWARAMFNQISSSGNV